MKVKLYKIKKQRRKLRVRSKVTGTSLKPRLSIFRSNKYIYTQLIDDVKKVTLASATDALNKKGTKVEKAFKAGEELAEKAEKAGIKLAVFDRGAYKYHGRVESFAKGARKGLKF